MPKVVPIKKYTATPRIPATRTVPAKPAIAFDDPITLHRVIPISAMKRMAFQSEKQLESYRQMLYHINANGEFKYRTSRDDRAMFGLVVWRLK